jgi:lysophospholipase L1-like esterase
MGAQGGIALFKFCYVDIDAATDVPKMFAAYREGVNALKAKYPSLNIVPVTVPLTTVEPAAKAWLKGLLGRTTTRDINAKRNQFNTLLRETYAGTGPVFDLAEVESVHRDGSRSYFTRGNEKIYTLAPEFTADGGHLNEMGRRVAAERLLSLLAQL